VAAADGFNLSTVKKAAQPATAPLLMQIGADRAIQIWSHSQARHKARRQRRPAGLIGVNGAELLLHEAPVDLPRSKTSGCFMSTI
jgi:hypothetical protein